MYIKIYTQDARVSKTREKSLPLALALMVISVYKSHSNNFVWKDWTRVRIGRWLIIGSGAKNTTIGVRKVNFIQEVREDTKT